MAPECAADADCGDGDPCTVEAWVIGSCIREPTLKALSCAIGSHGLPTRSCLFVECALDEDCDDGDGCTADRYLDRCCRHAALWWAKCEDGDPNTESSLCLAGRCVAGCETVEDCGGDPEPTVNHRCLDSQHPPRCTLAAADFGTFPSQER